MANPDCRAAGIHSGSGHLTLDAGKKHSGLLLDTISRHPPVPSAHNAPSFVRSGDGKDVEVLHRTGSFSSVHESPSRSKGFQTVAIPGYGGHIAGKVAENMHGGTFRQENNLATQSLPHRSMRRTWSEPLRISCNSSAKGTGAGLEVAPRIPGYMGTIPGKMSETVHAVRFGEANEMAQAYRRQNHHVTCEGWLKRGVWPVDRLHTYKFNNRFIQSDGQELFHDEHLAESYECNKRLGHTFGIFPPKPNPHKPGDRYIHSKYEKKKVARLDPSKVPAAGSSSYAPILEGQRWQMHHALQLKNGNQRMV
eukprot:TRINITY_DN54331_c0_g1_i1.p1 TRINITY_DN54331_c0_g1~~TRINITY_DN54331_c0_g1_i1.p1  ORF type:complete len:335 (-),score=29.96 TRINITY_DN54331_c0_g1_i1:65-988(-)